MTNSQSNNRALLGSFAEARRFRLTTALSLSYAERLQDLDAMWDFNEVVETQNPHVRRIAAKLRERRNGTR